MGLGDVMESVALGLVKTLVPKSYRVRIRAHMLVDRWAMELTEREKFLNHAFQALKFNGIDGDYAEFGCSGGHTFGFAYHQAIFNGFETHLWAFDSFQGLPSGDSPRDDHPVWQEGALRTDLGAFRSICRSNDVPEEAYTTVEGYYSETLDNARPNDEPRNIALAYIDCDMYSSTKSVMNYLLPRMKHGMILAFDDYFCWSPTQVSGERLAMMEAFDNSERWNLLPYLQYSWAGMSFVIEDKHLLKSAVFGESTANA